MKKFLLLLIICLTATLVSCNKESTFVVNNYRDFVTSYQGSLLSDSGGSFRVVENKTDSEAWKQEGGRFYILCDILNRELDIVLKDILNVRMLNPKPLEQMVTEFKDPIIVEDSSVSGGCFNLFYTYYYNPASNYAHNVQAWWELKGIELNICLFHDGNGENPSLMNADLLKEKTDVFSVPLADILKDENYDTHNSLHLSITLYELASDKKSVEKKTYHLNGN